jgi:hypothetical protein
LIFITFTNPERVESKQCDTTNNKRYKNLSGD